MNLIELAERAVLPDFLIRAGMRHLIGQRLRQTRKDEAGLERFAQSLRSLPIALDTRAANDQHYELPTGFFQLHLGPRMKYSCCYYPRGDETLPEAEVAMLALYAERAELADGQRILDLGCGWGSFALWAAERYPRASIVALSNSRTQRRYIERLALERRLDNVQVVTGDIASFEFEPAQRGGGFDRIVSIEMFEHMKNYERLLAKLAGWLKPDGRLFVHMFAHRELAYHFEAREASDWMTRYFFTGGTMPAADLLAQFPQHLRVQRQWWVDGTHYRRTARQWLERLDRARGPILEIFQDHYAAEAARWFQRWRMFYLAVAELFGYRGGREWGVVHAVLAPTGRGV
jgi:cyclopropane-fatty-acyl-phospholipid synthase